MSQILRQSTQIIVRIGPFVDVTDGFTPETGITLSGADEAELLKANGAATVSIAAATWAAIAGADGWYDLTLTTSHTDTVGTLSVVVNDDSVCLPVFARFQVIEEAVYDGIYAASAGALATAAAVDAVDNFVDSEVTAIKTVTDQFVFGTANRVNAQVYGMETDSLTSSALAGSAAAEIASAVVSTLATTGSVSAAGLNASSSDVDIANNALDLLVESPITAFTDDTPEARWLSRNYPTSRDAELRDHPWKFARKRRKLYPLDFALTGLSGTLSGAWGTIRLTEDWTGDLLTIRRSSDSTTDNFTIAEDSIAVDSDAIGTFVGSGTGYVSQFFDQSGNGRALAQATTTKQPSFGAEIGGEERSAAVFDGVDDLLATSGALSNLISTTAGYVVVVGMVDALSLDSATSTTNHLLVGDASSKIGLYARLGGMLYGINDDGGVDVITDAAPLAVPFVAELRHEGGTLYSRVNGEGEESATSGTTSSLAGALNVGDLAGGSHALDFNLFAVLTFSTAPTAEERNRLVKRLMRWVGAGGYEEFGWSYRYPIPADCGRILRIRTDGEFDNPSIDHEIEDGCILTDQAGPLYVLYIEKGIDATRFDPLFSEALAAKIAMKGAHWFTGKASLLQQCQIAYDTAIKKAKRANAFEGTPERDETSAIIEIR